MRYLISGWAFTTRLKRSKQAFFLLKWHTEWSECGFCKLLIWGFINWFRFILSVLWALCLNF